MWRVRMWWNKKKTGGGKKDRKKFISLPFFRRTKYKNERAYWRSTHNLVYYYKWAKIHVCFFVDFNFFYFFFGYHLLCFMLSITVSNAARAKENINEFMQWKCFNWNILKVCEHSNKAILMKKALSVLMKQKKTDGTIA